MAMGNSKRSSPLTIPPYNNGKMQLILPLLAVFLATSGAAQNSDPTTTLHESISVGYNLIPFVVTDSKGRPVKDLKARDVTLLIDGQPVLFDSFDRVERAPVSFAILLDGSGSMGLAGKMEGAKAALRELIAERLPGDEYALYVFARGDVQEVVPFTLEAGALMLAVDQIVPYGKTAFFDALSVIPEKTLLGSNGSRAIILLTDGLDNASTLPRVDLEHMLQGLEIPVYPLGLRTPEAARMRPAGENLLDLDILGEIATASGGRLAISEDPAKLREAVRTIVADLRSEYLVGFAPTGQGGVKYRRIAIRLAGKGRHVKVKAGYRGSDPPLLRNSTSPKKRRGRS
jgi:Ca-activated chloride channel family protein